MLAAIIFYMKRKTSDIQSLIVIQSFHIAYILTKRGGMFDLPSFFSELCDWFLLSKPCLQIKTKSNYLIIVLLKTKNMKNVKKVMKLQKKKIFHQICRRRYHRHKYSKNKMNQWNGTTQDRHSTTLTPAHLFFKRKEKKRLWKTSNTSLKFAQIEHILFRISYRIHGRPN